jgi:hypothetical protein
MDGRIFTYIYLSGYHVVCTAAGRRIPCLREYSQSFCANYIFCPFYFVLLFEPQCTRCSDVEQSPPTVAYNADFWSVSSIHLDKCKADGSAGGRQDKIVELARCDSRYAWRCHGARMFDCMVDVIRSIPIHSPYEIRINQAIGCNNAM